MRNYSKYLFHIPLPSPLSKFFLQKWRCWKQILATFFKSSHQEPLPREACISALMLINPLNLAVAPLWFSSQNFLILKKDISLKKNITPWFLTAARPGLTLLLQACLQQQVDVDGWMLRGCKWQSENLHSCGFSFSVSVIVSKKDHSLSS